MIPGIILALICAAVDWLAVAKGWKRVEYIFKPATMVVLFVMLALTGGFGSPPLICFGLGILFSLAGDVFLMLSDRWFLPGLVAFLLAQIAYIVGLNIPLPNVPMFWSLGLAIILAITAGRVLRRIIAGLREKGHPRLVIPVVVYGMIITIMLLSAMLTLYRPDWGNKNASALVALGAAFFFISDLILAWNKFVAPIRNGRIANMVTYHLGQIGLVIGVILQFGH
jgi:uncharacterized membrane protein YhhN